MWSLSDKLARYIRHCVRQPAQLCSYQPRHYDGWNSEGKTCVASGVLDQGVVMAPDSRPPDVAHNYRDAIRSVEVC